MTKKEIDKLYILFMVGIIIVLSLHLLYQYG